MPFKSLWKCTSKWSLTEKLNTAFMQLYRNDSCWCVAVQCSAPRERPSPPTNQFSICENNYSFAFYFKFLLYYCIVLSILYSVVGESYLAFFAVNNFRKVSITHFFRAIYYANPSVVPLRHAGIDRHSWIHCHALKSE